MDTKQKPTFASLGLSPAILKAVEALGFEEPAPIQAAAIPVMIEGHDVVGQSQTGSGKTAAFAIPAIEKCDPASRAVQVLILCPTRELATQVAEEVHKLAIHKRGIHAVPVYGGASYDRQLYELKKGVQIVIGTPGRVLDHIERRTLVLGKVGMVVLDEADRMLDMGFRDDIGKILDATPKERQTVFFSATMSAPIRELIKRYSRDPKTVRIEQAAVTVPTVEQWFYEVPFNHKVEALLRLIDYHAFKLGIIFCNTQRMVDELTDTLLAQGFSADRLHGGMAQAQRTRVMDKFKKAEFEFLVATDVAGRGIDVDDLELVVNYDLPYDAEDYVHRIGRTGRCGKRGMAITFVSGRDIYKLTFIERFTRTRIRRGKMPTVGEVEEKRNDILLEKVRAILKGDAFASHTPMVDRLLEEGFASTDIACAVLQMLTGAAEADERPAAKPAAAGKAAGRPAASPAERPAEEVRMRTPAREELPTPRPTPAPVTHTPRPERERPAPITTPRPSRKQEEPRPEYMPYPGADRPAQRQRPEPMPRPQMEEEPIPVLRLAPRGSQWVRLDVGWKSKTTPKAIVSLLCTILGATPPRVGMIELTHTQSFAQVGKEHLKLLRAGPVEVDSEFGPVHLSLLPEKRPERHPKKPKT
jgi:ATP-dependent RNA helicase DeaD